MHCGHSLSLPAAVNPTLPQGPCGEQPISSGPVGNNNSLHICKSVEPHDMQGFPFNGPLILTCKNDFFLQQLLEIFDRSSL